MIAAIPLTLWIVAAARGDAPRVALYLRVSSEDQVRGWSLANQERDLRAHCKRKGWIVVAVYKEEGVSGLDDANRPEYQKMIAAIARWDIALAYKGDRFHRNTDNAREFLRQSRAAGKQVWTMAEGRLDAPDEGEAEYPALQPMASHEIATSITTQTLPAHESLQISDRVLPGKWTGKKAGRPQGRMPLGFTWNKADNVFVMTAWAKKFKEDKEAHGLREARRLNPIPSGRRRDQFLSERAAFRLLANIDAFEHEALLPNKQRTDEPGFFSKFDKKWPESRRALEAERQSEAARIAKRVTCPCGAVLKSQSGMRGHLLSSARHREWEQRERRAIPW